MWQNLELPANYSYFKSFNAYVNGGFDKAITGLYGKFSPLSSPILTQAVLSYFSERFKVTLLAHYKATIRFINKVGSFNHEKLKKNQFLWDRYALYIFCILMRIRNLITLFWSLCTMSPHIMVMEVATWLYSLVYLYLRPPFFATWML